MLIQSLNLLFSAARRVVSEKGLWKTFRLSLSLIAENGPGLFISRIISARNLNYWQEVQGTLYSITNLSARVDLRDSKSIPDLARRNKALILIIGSHTSVATVMNSLNKNDFLDGWEFEIHLLDGGKNLFSYLKRDGRRVDFVFVFEEDNSENQSLDFETGVSNKVSAVLSSAELFTGTIPLALISPVGSRPLLRDEATLVESAAKWRKRELLICANFLTENNYLMLNSAAVKVALGRARKHFGATFSEKERLRSELVLPLVALHAAVEKKINLAFFRSLDHVASSSGNSGQGAEIPPRSQESTRGGEDTPEQGWGNTSQRKSSSHAGVEQRALAEVPKLAIGVRFSKELRSQFSTDEEVELKVKACIEASWAPSGSTIKALDEDTFQLDDFDVVITIQRAAIFSTQAIYRLATQSINRGTAVGTYSYGAKSFGPLGLGLVGELPAPDLGARLVATRSVEPSESTESNLVWSHSIHANTIPTDVRPDVSVIVRYRGQDSILLLERAILCLAAMNDVSVTVFLCCQDIVPSKRQELSRLSDFAISLGLHVQVAFFSSSPRQRDLRSVMLSHGLKSVRKGFLGVLDYDDLLVPWAYSTLIREISEAGRSVAVARVWATDFESSSNQILARRNAFGWGYNYDDFFHSNCFPVHSFLINSAEFSLEEVAIPEAQVYMEDYFMTLQLFSKGNLSTNLLETEVFIGDYIHSTDKRQTLAITDQKALDAVANSQLYRDCKRRVDLLKQSVGQDQPKGTVSQRKLGQSQKS